MPMRDNNFQPVDRELLERCANILGPASAAAHALQDADRRAKAGEAVRFYRNGTTLIVEGTPGAGEER